MALKFPPIAENRLAMYRQVCIDRVITEAGVAKMTLYSHFRSKDDLILAVLKFREEGVLELPGQLF
jgi:AcrR family transcriptional regulator